MFTAPLQFKQPTLGESAQAFMEELSRRLPEVDDKGDVVGAKDKRTTFRGEYAVALSDTLRQRRFRKLSGGLRAMAEAALKAHGAKGVKAFLVAQANVPLDAASAREARRTLGPALEASVRRGQRELDTVDTAQAFALEHGLELLEGTIKGTYEAPAVADEQAWGENIKAGLASVHEGTGNVAAAEKLGESVAADLDGWQRTRAKPGFREILQAFTRPATLGYRASQFLARVRKELPENPTGDDFRDAVENQLKLRRFRDYEPGLRALARAAWDDHALRTNFIGAVLEAAPDDPDIEQFQAAVATVLEHADFAPHTEKLQAIANGFWEDPNNAELDCYLREQSELAADADIRDHWNRDCRTKLGEILATTVRNGKKELTTADTIQAFALDHGLEMLDATIKDRYDAPQVPDVAAWRQEAVARLTADLKKLDPSEPAVDFGKVESLMQGFETTFASWRDMPPAERKTLTDKIGTLLKDLKEQPMEVLQNSLSDLYRKIQQVPTEAHLATITATSLALLAKGGLAVAGAASAPWGAALALGLMGTMVLAWAAADFSGANYHWAEDNLPLGRTAVAFQDHHYDPRAVSTWPMIRNTHGTARMVTPLALTAASLPLGKMAAGLLGTLGVAAPPAALGALVAVFAASYLNGILYTQHIHGLAHAKPEELAPWERFLQDMKVFLPPEVHKQHHGKHGLGKHEFGVLNGMTNSACDKLGYFRMLEAIYEGITGKEVGWKHEPELREAAMRRKKKGFRPVTGCGI